MLALTRVARVCVFGLCEADSKAASAREFDRSGAASTGDAYLQSENQGWKILMKEEDYIYISHCESNTKERREHRSQGPTVVLTMNL
jgi:hypothetical protein